MSRRAMGLAIVAAIAVGHAMPARAEGTPTTRRLAVVVGANAAAPGRKPLRYAHGDARAVAQVLRDQGGFSAGDVHLLLDPDPAAVLAALDRALAGAADAEVDTMVLFYYSGHADTASLYPRGRPLSLELLRQRLEDGRAAMRIGIIDACRGGGWTGSKGLSESETFAIEQALDLSSHGSVLIASSSGLEDAHESVSLRGSFFTHHWNAALRGAADRNADDRITLSEAFEYARALTIRDTALHTINPQHPSFRFNLRGRGDPLLAELSPGSSVIDLAQSAGPLQIIHLGNGLLVAELPAGRRQARVSLPPGRYVVRRRQADQVLAREVRLGAGQRIHVREASLLPVRGGRLETKGAGQVTAESDDPRSRPPPSEFMLSYLWSERRYDVDRYGPYSDSWPSSETVWGVQGSFLWRHGRYLATRFGAGFARPESLGDGSMLATIGESVSWPLEVLRDRIPGVSAYAIEPYLAAEVSARLELEIEEENYEVPYRIQAGAFAGVRLYPIYMQVGYAVDLMPRSVNFDGIPGGGAGISPGRPGPAFEVGLRLVKNFE
jgi:Caspase domain